MKITKEEMNDKIISLEARIINLERIVNNLDNRTFSQITLGPLPDLDRYKIFGVDKIKEIQ